MIYYMDSKEFVKYFLEDETDKDILDSQYVLISSRIRLSKDRSGFENVINGHAMLFPESNVCRAMTDEDFESRYMNQLEGAAGFLAMVVKMSIEEQANIFFITSHKEAKLNFLPKIATYIRSRFKYPVYHYLYYKYGAKKLDKYDVGKTLRICNDIIKDKQKKEYSKRIKSDTGRSEIMEDFKEKTKKELKKLLKEHDLYRKGLEKFEMLDIIETFLDEFI